MKRGIVDEFPIQEWLAIPLITGYSVLYVIFLIKVAYPRLLQYLERRFDVTITESIALKNWTVHGGSPLKKFGIEFLQFPLILVAAAGWCIPVGLMYVLTR